MQETAGTFAQTRSSTNCCQRSELCASRWPGASEPAVRVGNPLVAVLPVLCLSRLRQVIGNF